MLEVISNNKHTSNSQIVDTRYIEHLQDQALRLSVAVFKAWTIHLTTLLHKWGHKQHGKVLATMLRLASTLKTCCLHFLV